MKNCEIKSMYYFIILIYVVCNSKQYMIFQYGSDLVLFQRKLIGFKDVLEILLIMQKKLSYIVFKKHVCISQLFFFICFPQSHIFKVILTWLLNLPKSYFELGMLKKEWYNIHELVASTLAHIGKKKLWGNSATKITSPWYQRHLF